MKTRILITCIVVFSSVVLIPDAFAMCAYNEDWPQKPCLDTPPYSLEEQKQAIGPYYDYKGSEWMEEKKLEMITALENGNFREWVDQPDDYSHWNVYDYYSIFEGIDHENYKPAFAELTLKLDDFASELWYDHEFIIDGTILDITGYDKSERVYNIQINSFFKPTEGAGPKVITVYGSPNFYNIKGDKGIFFIKKDDTRWVFGEYGTKITGECLPELMYHNPPLIDPPLTRGMHPIDYSLLVDCYPHYYKKYLPQYMKAHGATEFPSPLSQQIDGVTPSEVVCNEGLELVMKNNGRVSCVKPSTIEKLLERKWAKPIPSMFRDETETKEARAKIDEEWPTGGILRYEKTPPIIDETYHLRSVKGWQDFSREQLMTEHAIFGDEFFTELGRLLVKNEMTYQLQRLGIINANDDFNVYVGAVDESLPPHIYFEAVVNGTDNNTYRLQGAAHANRVNYYKTEVLEFYDTTQNIPVESILTQPQMITILPKDGHNPRANPTNAIIHLADNKLEFFNNSPHTVRIQDKGSGKIFEEHELDWIGTTLEPNQSGFVNFNGTGFYEWGARTSPEPDRPELWGSHTGGRIVVLSLNTNSLPLDVKMKMAGTIIMESEIPRTSLGMGNNRGFEIGFNRAIYEMLPDAEMYYKARAEQLIPFDVPVIIKKPYQDEM